VICVKNAVKCQPTNRFELMLFVFNALWLLGMNEEGDIAWRIIFSSSLYWPLYWCRWNSQCGQTRSFDLDDFWSKYLACWFTFLVLSSKVKVKSVKSSGPH